MGKIIGFLICAAVVIGVVLGGGGLLFATHANTAPDQVAVYYKAGPISSTKFDHCIAPGHREMFKGVADEVYTYPAGQRTYAFTAAAGDVAPLVVLTKENIELNVEGVVRYNLTDDCDTLKTFHEQIGLKYNAQMDGNTTSEGWRTMLATYLQTSLQRAMTEATQEYSWKDLYNNSKAKAEWENKVKELLPRFVEQSMGGNYFGNYSLTIQKPTLPADLVKALQDTQTAIEQNNAQKQRNATVRTEMESMRELVEILGPDAYNVYQAIKDGKVQVMPIPQGSSVMMNPGQVQAPTEGQ